MTLESLLGGVKGLVTTGTDAYGAIRNVKEGPAPAPAAPPTPAGSFAQPGALPWYKAKWVIPAAVVLVAVAMVFLIRRRK